MRQVKYCVIRNFNGAYLAKDGKFTGHLAYAIGGSREIMEELKNKLPVSESLEVVELNFSEEENNS